MSILVVAAVPAEAAAIQDHEVLITGVGTVPAAIALTRRLATGPLPERIINVGTAGSLIDDAHGTFTITEVTKHDFAAEAVEGISEHIFPLWIPVEPAPGLPTARLATGDTFVKSSALRATLAQEAQLVDMEGYALAAAAATFGVPMTMLKHVSDPADETAGGLWHTVLERAASELASALRKIV